MSLGGRGRWGGGRGEKERARRAEREKNEKKNTHFAFFADLAKKKKKSTSFSTGPGSRPTHWKQTVLYLDEPVVLCAGEKMQASLRCAPNAGNPRDLDIELEYRSGGSRGAVGPRQQSFRMR